MSHWSLFHINYFFGINRMSLLISKENTLGFALLCLTSLTARILKLGDAWDSRDRGQSRLVDNQLFSCQKLIKRLRHVFEVKLFHSLHIYWFFLFNLYVRNFVLFFSMKWAAQFSALQAFSFTSPELFPSGRYYNLYLIMVVANFMILEVQIPQKKELLQK